MATAVPGPASDKITLNGSDYYIKGPVIAQPIAEFESGLKVGSATYDNRENAFYLVLDDFSGGIGRRRLNIREALGTIWDGVAANSADTSRAGQVTLGPYQYPMEIPASGPTANNMLTKPPSYPFVRAQDTQWLCGIGSAIYKSTSGLTWTRVYAGGADAGECQSIVTFVDKNGTIIHFACFSSTTGAATGNARYVKSTDNGNTWANGASDKVLTDMIAWDNKLIAMWGRQIIFAVLVAGVETWNIDIAADGYGVGQMEFDNHGHFVGVVTSPAGEPAVHFTDEHGLWWLDFFSRKVYPIELGLGGRILCTAIWNGDILLSDGWNVWQYSPRGVAVRNIGMPIHDGVPPMLRYSGGDFPRITALIPTDDYLHAIVSNANAKTTVLARFNGNGWNFLGETLTDFYSNAGVVASWPLTGNTTARYIYMFGAATATSTTAKIATYWIPAYSNSPTSGVGDTPVSVTGGSFITGWTDGGFAELNGALLRMTCDGFNFSSTETVKVEYQLDNNESGSWTQLVDANGTAALFTNTVNKLYYGSTAGLEFRTVRYRVTLYRGSSMHATPELRSLTMVYNKKPALRMSWTFTVDVDRMVKEGFVTDFEDVYTLLRTAWNTKTLINFTVNNITTNAQVQVSQFNVMADNVRSSTGLQGQIQVTLLEPVV